MPQEGQGAGFGALIPDGPTDDCTGQEAKAGPDGGAGPGAAGGASDNGACPCPQGGAGHGPLLLGGERSLGTGAEQGDGSDDNGESSHQVPLHIISPSCPWHRSWPSPDRCQGQEGEI